MQKRLAVIGVILAGVWLVTPLALSAQPDLHKHGGPPAVGAGTGRLHVTSEKQTGQTKDPNTATAAVAKPAVQASPVAPLQKK
jgi:hypothetical protein